MFDVGLQEMLLIGVIALLVFGPSKLPELGRMLGRAMREFRRASDEFRQTVETNLHINDPDPVIQSPAVETPPAPVGDRGRARLRDGRRHRGRRARRALLRPARLAPFPQERLRLGEADSGDRAPVLQARRRGARRGLRDLPRLRALGSGVLTGSLFLVDELNTR